MLQYTLTRRLYLVCYDIEDNDARHHVWRIVRSFSSGGQKSAYECYLSVAEYNLLKKLTQNSLSPSDNFVIQPINETCPIRVLGCGTPPLVIGTNYIG